MPKFVDVEWIIQQLRDDPRLQRLPKAAQAEAAGEILTTLYIRKIKNHSKISRSYIAKTVRYYLIPRRRGDPYVERFRRLRRVSTERITSSRVRAGESTFDNDAGRGINPARGG